jgi:phosphosulfolactate synthase
LTILIDNGLPFNRFQDVVESFPEYIDQIKLGWCTGLLTKSVAAKIQVARAHEIDVFFGGTLFEKCVLEGKVTELVAMSKDLGCRYFEVSNGTIDLDVNEKCKYIAELARDFQVYSEVGYKSVRRSLELYPAKWIEYMKRELGAGANKVITEARESGRSGICRENGELRVGLITEMLQSSLTTEDIIFEAPTKSLQVQLVKMVGANVNLANIFFDDVIALETLRLGLRADTLLHFDQGRKRLRSAA